MSCGQQDEGPRVTLGPTGTVCMVDGHDEQSTMWDLLRHAPIGSALFTMHTTPELAKWRLATTAGKPLTM